MPCGGPAAARNRASTASAARHQSSGSCSAQPGRGVENGYPASAAATTPPSASRASPLTPLVPTSNPNTLTCAARSARRRSCAQGGVDELVRGHGVLARLRLSQRLIVDSRCDRVDEVPLDHRTLDRADLILGVGAVSYTHLTL